jgi:hypothetical protein
VVYSFARLECPGADISSGKEDTLLSTIPIVGDISNKRRVRTGLGMRDVFGLADKLHTLFQMDQLLEVMKKKSKKTNLQT